MYKTASDPLGVLIFFFLFLLVLVDLEIPQLVALLRVGNNTQPVAQIVLLQIFLGQVLEIS